MPEIKSDYKYNIGDRFTDGRDIEIIDRKIVVKNVNTKGKIKPTNIRYYKIKCHICGWDENWILQSQINGSHKYHCSCCNNNIVVPGINDIATTHPEKIKYFVNYNDVINNTYGTSKKAYTKCPECGDVRLRQINDVIREEKYSCKKCGDGFSIPEKFMYNILRKCGIDFIHQLSKKVFPWCGKYYYDFYIPSKNMIIEMNGIQHYYDKFNGSVKEQKRIDEIKRKLALDNGIEKYIVIPILFSEYDVLVGFVRRSKLFDILEINFDTFDFVECYKNTCSSLVKTICEDFNKDSSQKIADLASRYNVTRPTIRSYLKRGNMFGWCNFNEEEMKNHKKEIVKRIGHNNAKPVEIFKEGRSLGIFKSATDLSKKSFELFGIDLVESKINAVCRGVYKTHRGYTFKRLSKEEYSKRKETEN